MELKLNDNGRAPRKALWASAGAVLAVGTLIADTATEGASSFAVLYIVVLLIVGEVGSALGIIATAAGCTCFALFTFTFAHWAEFHTAPLIPFTLALTALGATAALLVRGEKYRSLILKNSTLLAESEAQYRRIFDRTRVALLEYDLSALGTYLASLKKRGIKDLREQVRLFPEIGTECLELIIPLAENRAAREFVPASSSAGSGCEQRGPRNGARFLNRLFQANHDVFVEFLGAIFEQRECFDGTAVLRSNGETKNVQISVGFPGGSALYARTVVSIFDITQREEAHRAIEEARFEISNSACVATAGVLTASLSHELNQPLAALVANAQAMNRWVQQDTIDVTAIQRITSRLVRESTRASEIVRDTRDALGRADRGPSWLALGPLIQETVSLLELELQRHEVNVELRLSKDLPAVKVTRIEMQQVLINVIINAIEAMVEAKSQVKKIVVSMRRSGDTSIMISVLDTGPGLRGQDFAHLSLPFVTYKENRVGLGLFLSRAFIEAVDGSLDGLNHPNGGAEIVVTIPIGDLNE